MDGTHVGHLSYVGDSVFGEKCNLGAGTIIANLRFDDGKIKMIIKDKAVDTGRRKLGAIFGDNVKTGIKSLFMPGVKVGANSWVGQTLWLKEIYRQTAWYFLSNNVKLEKRKASTYSLFLMPTCVVA